MRILALATFLALCSLAGANAQPVASTPPRPPALPYGAPLSATQAEAVMTAAEAEARRNSWDVAIAIVEPNGQLVMFKRHDNVQYGSTEVAMGKAKTAAFFRQPSKGPADMLAGGNLSRLSIPNMLPIQGGVPITVDGRIIGAIGVSGVTAQQDEQIALAGAAAAR